MILIDWPAKLLGILAAALLTAVAAAALPDNPYQRWQQVENTLYANAAWSYERIHFDPRPVDVAIIGSSRSQIGLSAPQIAAKLASLGQPATVANMSVIEDGRNLEWAVADELFKVKHPKLLIILVNETPHRWGHPGFKYIAPAAAVAWPPQPFLHNSLYDITYLPFRQLRLFAASLFPETFGLRTRFDPARYASLPTDFTTSQVMADGKLIDMDVVHSADDLRAEARAFAATQKPSRIPPLLTPITDADDPVYLGAIARLAAAHGTRVMFVFLPEFGGSTVIEGRGFYTHFGPVEDYGDLSRDPSLFQSFSHLNRKGALIASDRIAAAAAPLLAAAPGDRYARKIGDGSADQRSRRHPARVG
ncbi:hypothetical protein [Polymorphobacter megasporae]|uniref:hypothetical protein n=1 Tax=Glacieibacterium megasporae TaxID=2835787 RepID=UPI001C1E8473|nr:hypothetical protein [Polymorphobacter megasporae]UAJ11548.1 hypothetical protein KTC28_07730 [Polymorphobacter megasporae]